MNEISGKEKLKREIFTKPSTIQTLLSEKFENGDYEAEYQERRHSTAKTTRILVQIILTCYYLLNAFISFKSFENIIFLVVSICLAGTDLLLFAANETSKDSSILRYLGSYLKLIINLAYFLSYDVFISMQSRYNKQTSLVRNFYIQQILLFFEYSFFIPPSASINRIIVGSYFVIFSLFHVQESYFQEDVIVLSSCRNDSLFVIPEISCCVIMYVLYNSITIIEKNQREVFCFIKQTETFVNYFATFINNMNSQLISVVNDEVLIANSSLIEHFKSNAIFSKDLQYTYDDRINFFDTCLIEKHKISHVGPEFIHNEPCLDITARENQSLKNNPKIIPSNEVASVYFSTICSDEDPNFSLLDGILNLIKKEKEGEKELSHLKFKKLGNFYNQSKTRIYEISYRTFKINNFRTIFDFIIDDTTQIRYAETISTRAKVQQQLFSKIAHEFKTPIITLVCLAKELMTNSNCHENDRMRDLKKITYLSDYILFLINDIIYSTEHNQISFQIDEVDLREVVDFSEGILRALISVGCKSNVEVISRFDEDLLYVKLLSDKTRLKQVLINFISNSVKFTKSGQIKLEAYIQEGCIVLSITDTGLGMKSEYLEMLRDPQDIPVLANTDKMYNEMGTGLGIRIVKTILKKLNHAFEVDSVVGKGTCFRILIKEFEYNSNWHSDRARRGTIKADLMNQESLVKVVTEFRSSLQINERKASQASFRQFSKKDIENLPLKEKRILIVEDSPPLRKALVKVIEEADISKDHDILEGEDGKDILSCVISNQQSGVNVSIIISDENMEYINGSEAFRILRSLEKQQKLPRIFIISLTAFSDEDSKQKIRDSGADLVITKPMTKSAFAEAFKIYNKALSSRYE